LLSILAIGLSSCLKNDTSPSEDQPSYLLVVNTAETLNQQDFFLNGNHIATGLDYMEGIPYFSVPTNASITGDFRSAGNSTSNGTFSISSGVGYYYSAFLTDDKAVVTSVDSLIIPAAGKAKVRFANLSLGINAPVSISITGGATLSPGLAYKTVSQYYSIDPASAFTVKLASGGTAVFSIPSTFQAGHIYTIYFSGATTATATYHLITQI